MLTRKWNLCDCAAAILRMGPSYVVVKKGEHGAFLFSRKGVFIVPAYPVRKLVDPTGAGDSYAGAFMGYLARAGRVTEGLMREALVHASAVASFGVEGFSLERLIYTLEYFRFLNFFFPSGVSKTVTLAI